MPLEFINIHGDRISDAQITMRKAQAHQDAARKKKSVDQKAFHKGWRVTGIPPGALEEARADHSRAAQLAARSGGRPVKPFDENHWAQSHRGKPVRSKPFETESAAEGCAALAQKCGWTRVRIEAVSRGVEPAMGWF